MYLRPIADPKLVAGGLEKIEPDEENLQDLIEIAVHEGMAVPLGYQLVLETVRHLQCDHHVRRRDRPAAQARSAGRGRLLVQVTCTANCWPNLRATSSGRKGTAPARPDAGRTGGRPRLAVRRAQLPRRHDASGLGDAVCPRVGGSGRPAAGARPDGVRPATCIGSSSSRARSRSRTRTRPTRCSSRPCWAKTSMRRWPISANKPSRRAKGPAPCRRDLRDAAHTPGPPCRSPGRGGSRAAARHAYAGLCTSLMEVARRAGQFDTLADVSRQRGDLVGFAAALVEQARVAGQGKGEGRRQNNNAQCLAPVNRFSISSEVKPAESPALAVSSPAILPSSFVLRPSSFILLPSAFILLPFLCGFATLQFSFPVRLAHKKSLPGKNSLPGRPGSSNSKPPILIAVNDLAGGHNPTAALDRSRGIGSRSRGHRGSVRSGRGGRSRGTATATASRGSSGTATAGGSSGTAARRSASRSRSSSCSSGGTGTSCSAGRGGSSSSCSSCRKRERHNRSWERRHKPVRKPERHTREPHKPGQQRHTTIRKPKHTAARGSRATTAALLAAVVARRNRPDSRGLWQQCFLQQLPQEGAAQPQLGAAAQAGSQAAAQLASQAGAAQAGAAQHEGSQPLSQPHDGSAAWPQAVQPQSFRPNMRSRSSKPKPRPQRPTLTTSAPKTHVPFHRATSPLRWNCGWRLPLRQGHASLTALARPSSWRDFRLAGSSGMVPGRLVGGYAGCYARWGKVGRNQQFTRFVAQNRSSQSLTRKVRSGCPDAPFVVPGGTRSSGDNTYRIGLLSEEPLRAGGSNFLQVVYIYRYADIAGP